MFDSNNRNILSTKGSVKFIFIVSQEEKLPLNKEKN